MIWALAAFIVVALLMGEYFLVKRLTAQKFDNFQNSVMHTYYEDVDGIYKKMRGWKHDFHNHLQVMNAYLELQNYDELNAYLDTLCDDMVKVDTVIKTGNMMGDAILNTKAALAAERNIALNIKAAVPKNIPISDLELCVIIGNLFDNAIEGCLTLEDVSQRFIRVYIWNWNENFYISFTNSCAGKRNMHGGKFFTTKTGKHHGFGLSRIDEIAKKHGAYRNRQSEEGVFACELMFPLSDHAFESK